MSLIKGLKHVKSCWVGKSQVYDKPWGFERQWAAHGPIGGKILHLKEGSRTSLKYNTLKDECLFVLEGVIRVQFGTERTLQDPVQHPFQYAELRHGDCLNIQSGCPYRITAEENAQVIEISETKYNSQTIRIEDDYGR
tara:strand:+ start:234 stop:647 length:414 start_codon:yes stop_codon:yes gene_type:complete